MTWVEYENEARAFMEQSLGMELQEIAVDINGKRKKFDLVNIQNKVVGDVKHYRNTSGGNNPSAKRSTLNEYIWLLQKMPSEWKKFIVIGEDLEMARKYVRDYEPWLDGVNIVYYERSGKVIWLRGGM